MIIDRSLQPQQFPVNRKDVSSTYLFTQPSFDVDVLTILLKYRPETEGIPNQLNTNLNGAVYLGYRNDLYHVKYKPTPFAFQRNLTHYGFSFGVFAGFGATTMNLSVTKNMISI